jgi:hypothetical protein
MSLQHLRLEGPTLQDTSCPPRSMVIHLNRPLRQGQVEREAMQVLTDIQRLVHHRVPTIPPPTSLTQKIYTVLRLQVGQEIRTLPPPLPATLASVPNPTLEGTLHHQLVRGETPTLPDISWPVNPNLVLQVPTLTLPTGTHPVLVEWVVHPLIMLQVFYHLDILQRNHNQEGSNLAVVHIPV